MLTNLSAINLHSQKLHFKKTLEKHTNWYFENIKTTAK